MTDKILINFNDRRKKNGERLADILSEMRVLK